jgi:hypothetical protein
MELGDLEARTVAVMIRIHCRAHHGATGELCSACSELLVYARCRISRCTFGDKKPVCSHCSVHCFAPEMRQRIQEVMRYAGPRMIWRHPFLAIRHLLCSRKGGI